jgi:hypothetical protein
VKSKDIAQWRMHSLRLWGTPFDNPVDVVRHLTAVQAQEFPYAKWSVAQRTKDVDDAGIQLLIDEGAILRTHLLRPTWHFVVSEDIRWMLELTGPRVHALNAYMYRQLDVDSKLLAKSHRLLARHLAGGAHLTRKEIGGLLEGARIDATGLRLGYFLMHAELEGLICSGASRGKQQTYALLDERAPDAKRLDRDEALAELTRRYFRSRGPATLKDYSRWSSLKVVDCKRSLEMLDSELEHEVVGDRTYWFAPSSPPPKTASRVIDLVQVYDECVMSYSESRDALAGSVLSQETAFMHAILLDGQVIGHWKRVEGRTAIEVETSFNRALDRVETKALQKAMDRYSRFLGKPVTLV